MAVSFSSAKSLSLKEIKVTHPLHYRRQLLTLCSFVCRTFAGLKRGDDGRFNDVELAELLKSCVEEPAHEFGAHGTPASLRMVDILGMIQAREKFNVCTMNEFRKYLNLLPYKSFEDWNPDRETARAAELLYGHIDNLEL